MKNAVCRRFGKKRVLEKFVVKTAVKAALILLGMVLVAFAVFNFAFPQHMATFTESIGNYSLAVKYTSLRYTYTGDVYDLVRCVDDSVLSKKDEYIDEYGSQLLSHERFEEICLYKDELGAFIDPETTVGYKTFLCGKVAVSRYERGNFEGALELVKGETDYSLFSRSAPITLLATRVALKKDNVNAEAMLDEFIKVSPPAQSDENWKYFQEIRNRLRELKNTK